MQQSVVKTYKGRERDAMDEFQRDAEKMAAQGFYPISHSYAPGSYGAGSFILALLLCVVLIGILVFIYMIIVKPAGVLSVTYAKGAQASEGPAEKTKTCPQCAEHVKAAANICRFCGFKFPESTLEDRSHEASLPAPAPQLASGAHAIGHTLGGWWSKKWVRVTTYVVVGMWAIGFVGQLVQPRTPSTSSVMRASPLEKAQKEQALAAARQAEVARRAALTPEQRAAEDQAKTEAQADATIKAAQDMYAKWHASDERAKAYLDGREKTAPTPAYQQAETDAMRSKLAAIPVSLPQSKQARALVNQFDTQRKDGDAYLAAYMAKTRVDTRKSFAAELEKKLIDQRMNVDVTASGPKNTLLTVKYVLASKVIANDLSKSGIIQTAEKLGFKKVVLTDGYDESFHWDLHPDGA